MDDNLPFWLQVVSYVIAVCAVGVAVTFSGFKLVKTIHYHRLSVKQDRATNREIYNGQRDLVKQIGQDLSRLLTKTENNRVLTHEVAKNQVELLELVEKNDEASNDRYQALRRLLEGVTMDLLRIENAAGKNYSDVMSSINVVGKDATDGLQLLDRNVKGAFRNLDGEVRLQGGSVMDLVQEVLSHVEPKNEETEGSPEGTKVLTDIELLHVSIDALGNSWFNDYPDRVAAELKKRDVDDAL